VYRARTVDAELDALLAVAPAVAIEGPKGVGKTATAQRRARFDYYLDSPDQRAVASADLAFTGLRSGTILLDEWQRLPEVWDAVRRSVDAGAAPGRFLLTGSATPKGETHSGAGRIVTLRMRPMALHERGLTAPSVSLADLLRGQSDIEGACDLTLIDYLTEIEASGLPGIRTAPPLLRRDLLEGYLQRIIDRDFPEQGFVVRRPETLRRWLAAYAAASSTTTTYQRMLAAATSGEGALPAKTTTIAYREMLGRLWLLDPVHGWTHSRSALSRVQQAPKHQLADPALTARMLNLTAETLISARGAAMAGPLFESLATLSVRVAAQPVRARVGHLRTRNGDHEVDLVVEDDQGRVIGIEVKLAPAVDDGDVRHLLWLRDRLPGDVVDLMVLTTGRRAYRRADGVAVVPLGCLGP
jgi:uncharacterized protein